MRRGLSVDELAQLLSSSLPCTLATYRANGEVLLSPVWFEWRDGGFEMIVGRDDVKARHLRRDSRASVVLYDSRPPYPGIEVRGRGQLLTEGIPELRRSIWHRYTGGRPPGGDTTEVRVRVSGEVRAWDFADDFKG